MSKITKGSIVFLFITMLILNGGNIISYADSIEENGETSVLFKDFINEVYNNIDKLRVVKNDGEDVTDYFINKTKDLFDKKDYKAIQEIIVNEELAPFIEVTINGKNNNDLRC